MTSRIFGTAAARLLRTGIAPVSAKSTAVFGGTAAGGSGGFAAWKILAVASSSFAMVSAMNDTLETETTKTAFGETATAAGGDDDRAEVSAVPLLYRRWKALLSAPTMTTTTTTMCEASDPDLDADTEAKVEAVLKSRITSREELKERRDQRDKFLENQASSDQKLVRRRMTNVGRFSLVSETAENPSVPVLVLAMTGRPYFAKDFRRLYQERKVAEKHPRFAARLDATKTHFVFDTDGGAKSDGKKGRGDLGRDNVRDAMYPTIPIAELKDRINDASLYEPLDLNSRLWEAWTATGGTLGQSGAISTTHESGENQSSTEGDENNVESLLLFRSHHCMADGVSMGALFGDLMDEGPEIQAKIQNEIKLYKKKKKATPWWKKLLFVFYFLIWGGMKALLYQVYLFVISWWDQYEHDDPWMILKALYDERRKKTDDGEQRAVPPRSISWETIAPVDEVKRVAQFYSKVNQKETGKTSKVTINDIFCSCVSAAIVKQLEYHRVVNAKLSSSCQRLSLPSMNLIIPVHLQGGILLPGQSLGNKIGAMVSRIPGEHVPSKNTNHDDRAVLAQERLIKVHSVLNARKQTPIAALSYLMAGLMGYISPSSSSSSSENTNTTGYSVGSSPSSWTPWIFQKAHANASVVVTNVRGPESLVHLEGRPVRAFLGFLPLPAGVPVGLVVSSYDNKMNLTLTAEEYAVPDAEQFLGWIKDEYQLLKRRADEMAGIKQ